METTADMETLILDEPQRKGVRPKFTHCDICGEELPEEELRMQAVNHRKCWKVWVDEKRTREPGEAAPASLKLGKS